MRKVKSNAFNAGLRYKRTDITSNNTFQSKQSAKNFNPLNVVIITIDPTLNNSESESAISSKAVQAKKIFSNYRKNL